MHHNVDGTAVTPIEVDPYYRFQRTGTKRQPFKRLLLMMTVVIHVLIFVGIQQKILRDYLSRLLMQSEQVQQGVPSKLP